MAKESHPPGRGLHCSDLELLHQFFKLDGQFCQALGTLLHLAATFADLRRLLVDAGDIAGDIGNHLGDPLDTQIHLIRRRAETSQGKETDPLPVLVERG